MAQSENVRYDSGAEPSKKLAANQGYRLTVERTAIGYGLLWRPNALIEAWESMSATPYAWAVSPRPAPDTKVAVIDVKIKSALSLPAGATVQQMVEGINTKLGAWSHIYGIKGVTQSELTSSTARAETEQEARATGAGKTALEKLGGDFTSSFARAGRWLTIAGVIVAVGVAVVVVAKVRKAVKP